MEERLLYETYLPQFYRAAVCLLGDPISAEPAAAQAWIQAQAFATDESVFRVQGFRMLLGCCACVSEGQPAQYEQGNALLAALASLEFSARELAVVSLVLRCPPEETAQILNQPVWLVKKRLYRVSTRLCMKTGRPA